MIRAVLVASLLWCLGMNVWSHSLGISLLRLEELSPGVYSIQWQPSESIAARMDTVIDYPAGCGNRHGLLDCGREGLVGEIRLRQWPRHADAVLVTVPLGENASHRMFRDGSIAVTAPTHRAANNWQTALIDYLVIGIEHIVLGIDHLLFVLGVVLIVGFSRGLMWTVTAFTVSHSVTLGLSMFDLVTLPPRPVEIMIAASIVLVAREALYRQRTLTRRWPWLVAFLFGLVHGLGFAGALSDIGLPPSLELPALLAFNLGVEVGQLCIIGIFLAVARLFAFTTAQTRRTATISLCYGVGTLASFWTLERASGLLI